MVDIDSKRTLSQNDKMWPMLRDFERQVPWRFTRGGKFQFGLMPAPSWKVVLTAAFERELEMAEGFDGGMVMIGASTSNYGIRRMSEFIEFIYSAGSERGVIWSKRSEQIITESRLGVT